MPQTSQPLSKEYLLSQVSEIPELSIESSDNKGLVVWDDEDAKLLPVHFPEAMTVDDLVQRIHISSDIPEWYRADKKALAEYLWKACDHNAFITMNEVVVVWSQPDDAGTYMSFDFEDEQRKRLHEEYSDEYAYEIGEGVLGQLWFERNTAVVNMGEIVRTADEVATENEDLVVIDPFFSFENQVQTGFLTTVLHELRHLQMDTNIFLPEDMYPLELASENAVEEYCREAFEAHPINDGILPNIDAAPKQSIQAILDKAHDLMMYCDTGLIDNASDLSPLYLDRFIGEKFVISFERMEQPIRDFEDWRKEFMDASWVKSFIERVVKIEYPNFTQTHKPLTAQIQEAEARATAPCSGESPAKNMPSQTR